MAVWTAAEDQLLAELKKKGLPWAEIAKSFPGRSSDSARLRYRKIADMAPLPVAAFSESAKDTELEKLRTQLRRYEDRAPAALESPLEEETAQDSWARAERDSLRRISNHRKHGKFKASFDDGPIFLVAVSDQHIGPGSLCDFESMRRDAELIRDTPNTYAILVGDGVDNHVKHRAAVLAQQSTPDEQYHLYNHYLSIFADSILVVVSGNHDAWTAQYAGVDMVKRLCDANRILYSPDEARIDVSVGGATYQVAVRHQYRYNSTLNQVHTVKRWYDMGAETFDIGVIGHHHEHAIEEFYRHGKRRVGARPGSYQISTAYSRQFGFNDSAPSSPTFALFPGERRIDVFGTIRQASYWMGHAKAS